MWSPIWPRTSPAMDRLPHRSRPATLCVEAFVANDEWDTPRARHQRQRGIPFHSRWLTARPLQPSKFRPSLSAQKLVGIPDQDAPGRYRCPEQQQAFGQQFKAHFADLISGKSVALGRRTKQRVAGLDQPYTCSTPHARQNNETNYHIVLAMFSARAPSIFLLEKAWSIG